MNKEKLKNNLLTVLGMIDAEHRSTLAESTSIRNNLFLILNGENIPSALPSKCLEKYVTIFKEESLRVHDEELFYSGCLFDVQAILDDVSNDSINRSTKRLLGRLHKDCSYNPNLNRVGASALTGIIMAIMDGSDV